MQSLHGSSTVPHVDTAPKQWLLYPFSNLGLLDVSKCNGDGWILTILSQLTDNYARNCSDLSTLRRATRVNKPHGALGDTLREALRRLTSSPNRCATVEGPRTGHAARHEELHRFDDAFPMAKTALLNTFLQRPILYAV